MINAIDYRAFIEEFFFIRTKEGEIIPLKFNDVQNLWYDDLQATYGEAMQGIRENNLKGRQFGISTIIQAILTTDFIMSALGNIPLIDSDIYSHKEEETTAHFARINLFVESFLCKQQGGDYLNPEHRLETKKLRPAFLKIDTQGLLIAKNGVQIQTQTASAKVSGRGATKQNIHWSEVAFYPNTPIMSAETLVTGAEEQVPEGRGKIWRETTGNMAGDYFATEYYNAKEGKSEYHSRFLAWFLHKDYARPLPAEGWIPDAYYEKLLTDGLATPEQCYWHYMKTRQLVNKKRMREYPTYDSEAFLMAGTGFFDPDAMLYYTNHVQEPVKEAVYAHAL